MVPCLKGIHTDDAFSVVPYQKGSLFLYFLENKYGKGEFYYTPTFITGLPVSGTFD